MKKILLLMTMVLTCVGAWAQTFSTVEVGKYYKIKGDSQSHPWLTADMTSGGNVVVSANESDAAVFEKTTNGLRAVSTGKYLGYSNGKYTYSASEIAVELVNTGSQANSEGKYAIKSGNNWMYNNNTDGIVHESDAWLDLPRLWGFIDVSVNVQYDITDQGGNIISGTIVTYEGNEPTLPTFTGVNYSISNKVWDANAKKITADIELNVLFPISSATATNPTMISTYNYTSMSAGNFKWYASDNKVKVEREDEKVSNGRGITNSNVAAHLWCIYPVVVNGEFKFQIKNFATGQYVNSTANRNSHDDATVTLSNEVSNFTLGNRQSEGVEFINASGKRLSVNSSGTGKGEQNVGTWDSHYGTAVTFPTISYTVTVGEVGYASLYTPVAGTLNATACAITEDELHNGYVRLKEMNEGTATAIPANQGAIVVGAGTYTFTASDVEADWSGNLLKGTAVNTYVEGEAYVLSNKNGIGLYLAELNKNASGATGTTHFLNNAGKAYLKLPTASPVKAFLFEDGETTAIETVETENANAPIYDLSGRRVLSTVKGGIYIQNGKKFIVK